MNIARKLLLLALSVCAVMAFGAPNALAVEVIDEDDGLHCASGLQKAEDGADCQIFGEATDLELGGPFGAMIVCDVHLEGDVNEAGHAEADWYSVEDGCESGSANECTDTAAHRHPEARIVGVENAGVTPIEAEFCVITFLGQIECHVGGNVVDLGTHDYVMRFVHTTKCEDNASYSLQGDIVLIAGANHENIEVQ